MRPLLRCVALLASALPAAHAQSALCNQVAALTQDHAVAAAHWGIAVTTLDGTSLCALHDAQLFRPASNAKLFTSAAALALLGSGKTFETRLLGRLDPATGTITGDLTLLGGGDPNLDSGELPYLPPSQRAANPHPPFAFQDLEDLATQLAAAGVHAIAGDLVGDDTLFPYEPYPLSWSADDLLWGYGAPVSALSLADNQLRLTITPGRITGTPGHQSFPAATVTLDQHGVPYYTLQAEVQTLRPRSPLTGVQVERLPGSRTLRVFGAIAEDAPADVEEIAIHDPAAYAALALRTVLLAHGISVAGTTRARHQPVRLGAGFLAQLQAPGGTEDLTVAGGEAGGSCLTGRPDPTLATHRSAPLAADVLFTLKTSQNLHAELLLHALGRRVFCGSGSTVAGARMVRAFLLHAGLQPADFIFYDGSGLSDHDLVTPRSLARLLAFAATQPWFPQWKAALPIGGTDGSLAARFLPPASTLQGRVFAKTGTLGESRALSGYLNAASGQTLIFSLLVDTHTPTTNAERTTIDRIVELLATRN